MSCEKEEEVKLCSGKVKDLDSTAFRINLLNKKERFVVGRMLLLLRRVSFRVFVF